MRSFLAALAIAIPATNAIAQPNYDPMTMPVTPRDVAWYMARPSIMQKTLQVCGSNAAYADTADCRNANSASYGQLGRAYSQANARAYAANPALDMRNSAYWSANPIAREMTLTQCRRRGPGDDLSYPYCGVASQSKLTELGRR